MNAGGVIKLADDAGNYVTRVSYTKEQAKEMCVPVVFLQLCPDTAGRILPICY
jgi:hypothetical protein